MFVVVAVVIQINTLNFFLSFYLFSAGKLDPPEGELTISHSDGEFFHDELSMGYPDEKQDRGD